MYVYIHTCINIYIYIYIHREAPLESERHKAFLPHDGACQVEECIAFLPDILTCFNAMFCFFPEAPPPLLSDCVASLPVVVVVVV